MFFVQAKFDIRVFSKKYFLVATTISEENNTKTEIQRCAQNMDLYKKIVPILTLLFASEDHNHRQSPFIKLVMIQTLQKFY